MRLNKLMQIIKMYLNGENEVDKSGRGDLEETGEIPGLEDVVGRADQRVSGGDFIQFEDVRAPHPQLLLHKLCSVYTHISM